MQVAVIIATMNREKELKRCIDSISSQTVLPKELIIVDDGNLNQKNIKEMIPDEIGYKYHKKDKPSVSASRNIGAKLAGSEIVLFLDDDVVLEPNYIEELMNVFENDKKKEIGVVTGIIVNRKKRPRFFKYWERLFVLSLGNQGAILPWGFYTRIDDIDKVTETDWVPGGLSCFRREVFDNFQLYDFEEFGNKGGRHGLADIEFSLRISKKYRLVVTPFARLCHYKAETPKERACAVGYKQAFNQGVIFRKYSRKTFLNRVCFFWASVGLILGNFGAVLVVEKASEKRERLYRSLGNLAGAISFMFEK